MNPRRAQEEEEGPRGRSQGGPNDCIDKIAGGGWTVGEKVRRGEAGVKGGSEQVCV